ncbi:type II toxin-antitoxin system VapC family toxin [Methylobacter sp.]|uniref:type II toxin-antitoxin system VapC family toxin n=1 Tax=Methylobacter sp. TaxID=2051955 RepID=UPI0025E31D06|nr:type II toxin-antitoxin system VapC family toxin [Methylobacter sp.]
MVMYLLDTNVVSELRKAKSDKADKNVVSWANSVPATSLFLSVISILEIETGLLLVERRDPQQGAVLRSWLNAHVLPAFSERILVIDTAVALCCAKLHVPDPRSDRDAIIAATALVHGMTVVTRNTNDFKQTGVEILNPWEYT